MNKNCDTCAYQTVRWKVCTNKRKNAEVNQELLKENGFCHDYIRKSVLFSGLRATRYMYDIFISEVIEASRKSAEEEEKERAKKDWLKLRKECTINGKFSCLELMRKHLSLGVFGQIWKGDK